MKEISIKEIEGFKLGNMEDHQNGTGCTVIFAENAAVPGVDVRGGAPGTRETDLIRSEEMMPEINAVVLSGGSGRGCRFRLIDEVQADVFDGVRERVARDGVECVAHRA